MIRSAVVTAILFFISSFSFSQSDSIIAAPIFSFSVGLPIYQHLAEQDYGVELYSRSRNNVTNLKVGIQLKLDQKNRLEFLYQRTRFKMDESALATAYSERMPDAYIYSDFDIDNTNSTGNRFTLNSLELHYGRCYRIGKINLQPCIGLGAGLWSHRDYYYVRRPKENNNFTEYRFHLKKIVRPTYTASIRTGIQRFPNTFIELSLRGGPNHYQYRTEILSKNSETPLISTAVNYKRFIQTAQIGLIIAISE